MPGALLRAAKQGRTLPYPLGAAEVLARVPLRRSASAKALASVASSLYLILMNSVQFLVEKLAMARVAASENRVERVKALAYLRTSSAANVGGDSDKRQREAIQSFAKAQGYELAGEFLRQCPAQAC